MSDYTPPDVWKWESESGGRFASINRPVSGPTHDKALPTGEHPFQLYSLGTPNGQKITIAFEELLQAGFSEAEYDAWMINIMEGDQFGSGFVGVNPNSKIPALLDRSTDPPTRVWESGSILLYLANKFGTLLPTDPARRTEAMSWLFWQIGSTAYVGGGFGHFYAYAPTKQQYPIDRFTMETKRLLHVLDTRLADHEFVADEYSIADISIWPWYGGLAKGKLYDAGTFLAVHEYPNVIRWADQIAARPAVQRGRLVNQPWVEGGIAERH